jgi:hypothetical protein
VSSTAAIDSSLVRRGLHHHPLLDRLEDRRDRLDPRGRGLHHHLLVDLDVAGRRELDLLARRALQHALGRGAELRRNGDARIALAGLGVGRQIGGDRLLRGHLHRQAQHGGEHPDRDDS